MNTETTCARRRAIRFLAYPTFCSLLLVGTLAAAANPIANAVGPASEHANRIYVVDVAGRVDVTMAGVKRNVQLDSTVDLPTRIVTGNDGRLGIKQSRTAVSIASNSEIEIPEAAEDGQLIARLVQHSGNVFYDVEQREINKLRVETSYLVAVVKGTQFNVAVQEQSTTISLFEGLLEIRTPDGSDVVQLNAGEIAMRSSTDTTIRVLSMNEDRLPEPEAARAAGRDAALAGGAERAGGALADLPTPADNGGTGGPLADSPALAPGTDLNLAQSPAVDAELALALDSTADLGLDAGLDLGAGSADLGVDVGVDLGAGTVDLGLDAGLDLGAGTVDLGLDTGLDLGAGSADLGLDTGLDLGAGSADLGLDTGLDLGAGSADLGLDAGLDLGAGSADLGIDAGVDLGGADVGLDASVDLGLGPDADTGVDLDLGVGGLDVGVGLGGDGLDIDIGEEDGDEDAGGGGLLGGLLGGIL